MNWHVCVPLNCPTFHRCLPLHVFSLYRNIPRASLLILHINNARLDFDLKKHHRAPLRFQSLIVSLENCIKNLQKIVSGVLVSPLTTHFPSPCGPCNSTQRSTALRQAPQSQGLIKGLLSQRTRDEPLFLDSTFCYTYLSFFLY